MIGKDTPLVDRLSEELIVALVPHHIDVKPREGTYDPIRTIVGVTRIPSALRFAAALERAEADATYTAGSGWSFRDKRVGRGVREPEPADG